MLADFLVLCIYIMTFHHSYKSRILTLFACEAVEAIPTGADEVDVADLNTRAAVLAGRAVTGLHLCNTVTQFQGTPLWGSEIQFVAKFRVMQRGMALLGSQIHYSFLDNGQQNHKRSVCRHADKL